MEAELGESSSSEDPAFSSSPAPDLRTAGDANGDLSEDEDGREHHHDKHVMLLRIAVESPSHDRHHKVGLGHALEHTAPWRALSTWHGPQPGTQGTLLLVNSRGKGIQVGQMQQSDRVSYSGAFCGLIRLALGPCTPRARFHSLKADKSWCARALGSCFLRWPDSQLPLGYMFATLCFLRYAYAHMCTPSTVDRHALHGYCRVPDKTLAVSLGPLPDLSTLVAVCTRSFILSGIA